MKLHCVFLFICVVPALAQEPLPPSTEALLAGMARLTTLTQSDLTGFLSKAQAGDKEAQYWLALVYEEGKLVPKDATASREWMLKSAQQGYAPAQTGLGQTYLPTDPRHLAREYGEADRWLRLAAMQGDAEAQFWLGTGYEQGWYGVIDYREALNWLRKSAQQGLPVAQFTLGQMYLDGEGVPKSDAIAADWYRKAADHAPTWLLGVWDGAAKLVELYRDGRLPKDDVEAYMWSAVLGATSNPPSDDDIKKVSRRMSGAQISEAQRRAEDWIKRHPFETQTLAETKN